MPDTKITALTAIGANPIIPSTFPIPMVDLTDTSMAASGTTKKVTVNQILGAGGTATLASATITGDLTVDTSTLKVDSANDRVGIGIATPAWPLDIRSATAVAQILSTTGTNAAYLQVSNTGGIFYLGRENSAGTSFASPAYSAVLYAGGAYPLVTTVNGSERYRIASDGVATWSNVGGVAGTAMTLNSTGLGVGGSPSSKLTLTVTPATAGSDGLIINGPSSRQIIAGITGATYSYAGVGANQNLIYGGNAQLNILGDNQNVRIGTSAGSYLLLDTSGNVGIGVQPSATNSTYFQALEIARVGQGLTAAKNALTGSPSSWLSNNSYATYSSGVVWNYAISQPAAQYRLFEGQHQWYTAPSGTAGNAITFTERLRLKETGQLRFVPLASDPSGAEAGDVYYNSTSNKLKCYNGTTWNDLF